VIWAAAILVIVAFLVLLRALRAPVWLRKIVGATRGSIAIVRDPDRDEMWKAREMRALSLRLFGWCALLTGSILVAFMVPVGVLALLERAGVIDLGAVLERTLHPAVVLLTAGLALFALAVPRGAKRTGA
jgi:hypothetical protein